MLLSILFRDLNLRARESFNARFHSMHMGRIPRWLGVTGFASAFVWPAVFPFIPQVDRFNSAVGEGASAPDTIFFGSGDRIYAELDSMGPGGRDAYRDFEIVDLISPLFFGVGLALMVLFIAQRFSPARPRLQWLACVPLLAGAMDWFENLSMLWLLVEYPTRHPALANAVSAATTVKLLLGPGTLLAILVVLIVLGLRRMARRRTSAGSGSTSADEALEGSGLHRRP